MTIILRLALWLAALVASIVSLALGFIYVFTSGRRFWRVVVAHDQALNAANGGSEDETISSRAGRAAARGDRWGCVLCKVLDAIEKDHCKNSIGS